MLPFAILKPPMWSEMITAMHSTSHNDRLRVQFTVPDQNMWMTVSISSGLPACISVGMGSFFFISSVADGHLACWWEEDKRIKTSTGAKGPPEAKGGPCEALKGHKAIEEDFGIQS